MLHISQGLGPGISDKMFMRLISTAFVGTTPGQTHLYYCYLGMDMGAIVEG